MSAARSVFVEKDQTVTDGAFADAVALAWLMLLAATMIMALMVVTINRLVWRPLYHLAETKYRLD